MASKSEAYRKSVADVRAKYPVVDQVLPSKVEPTRDELLAALAKVAALVPASTPAPEELVTLGYRVPVSLRDALRSQAKSRGVTVQDTLADLLRDALA